MGKFLQIRLLAFTWRPEDLEEAWPRLLALAWPEPPYTPSVLPPGPKAPRGVLELVEALDDRRRFGAWSKDRKAALGPGIDAAVACKARLEAALADWNPALANACSEELEDALTSLEALAPKEVLE